MKALRISRSIKLTLMSLFTATLLSACGGGGDSSAGAGYAAGSSSITGNVSDGVAMNGAALQRENLLAAVYEVMISQAQAGGAAGVTVELYLDGAKVGDQSTDRSGNFTFDNLAPGNYSIQVVDNGRVLGKSSVISLDANTRTRIGMKMNGNLTEVKVEGRGNTISGEVENESTPDDSDSDKGSSNKGSSDDSKGDDSDSDKGSNDSDKNDDSKDDSNGDDSNDDDCRLPSCDDDDDHKS